MDRHVASSKSLETESAGHSEECENPEPSLCYRVCSAAHHVRSCSIIYVLPDRADAPTEGPTRQRPCRFAYGYPNDPVAGIVLPRTDKNPIRLRKGLTLAFVLPRTDNDRADMPTEGPRRWHRTAKNQTMIVLIRLRSTT
jgi:hypothetical protein